TIFLPKTIFEQMSSFSSSLSLPSTSTSFADFAEIKALEIFDRWKDPFTKYFEVTLCKNWSPEHYVNWIVECLAQRRFNLELELTLLELKVGEIAVGERESGADEVGTSKRRKVTDSERDRGRRIYLQSREERIRCSQIFLSAPIPQGKVRLYSHRGERQYCTKRGNGGADYDFSDRSPGKGKKVKVELIYVKLE
ncbi:9629_t:CDS:2, partial [Scutellospora calospora]